MAYYFIIITLSRNIVVGTFTSYIMWFYKTYFRSNFVSSSSWFELITNISRRCLNGFGYTFGPRTSPLWHLLVSSSIISQSYDGTSSFSFCNKYSFKLHIYFMVIFQLFIFNTYCLIPILLFMILNLINLMRFYLANFYKNCLHLITFIIIF